MVLLVRLSSKLLKHLHRKILLAVKSRWGRLWLTTASSAMSGWLIKVDAIEELNVRESGVFPNRRNRRLIGLRKRWYFAEQIQRVGSYHEAVGIREEILSEIYEYHGIENTNYYPPFLGTSWSSNFGHLSAIGHLQLAQSLDIVRTGQRFVLDNSKPANHELFKVMTNKMSVVRQINGTAWTELPEFWHLAERIRTIKAKDGFIDGVKLFDEIFAPENMEALESAYFKLDEEQIDYATRSLQGLGLPKNSPFVTFHIRESYSPLDSRTQPKETFFRAIEELNDKGIWVVRIGDSNMEKFPPFSRFIDLTQMPNAGSKFHPYLLSHCEFFVGTASGPSWVPRLFGKPSLITNINEIGTQMSRGPRASIFLPKKYIREDGSALGMRELFERGFAYASLDKAELKTKGFSLEHNSEQEISLAVNEILENYQEDSHESHGFAKEIEMIRSEFKAVANGNFAYSYIERNQELFD
jgi:putative glycosyltransferase (TIGR04372 family)